MRVRTILLLVTLCFIFPLVNAQTYQQSEAFDLKVPFEVNGTIASGSAVCNISVQYPNSTYLHNHTDMTNMNNGYFNLSLNSTQTEVAGFYNWVASCCDTGNCAMGYGEFEITRTGNETPENIPIFFGIFIVLLFGIACFFLFFSMKIDEPGPKIFFMILSLLFVFGSIGVAVSYADTSNVTEQMSNLLGVFLFSVGLVILIIFFYVIIRQIVDALNLMRVKKGLAMPVGEYKPKGAY